MKHLLALILLFFGTLIVPAAASAALKPDDDPTLMEGLRDKGVDWLKDKAKEAGKGWIFDTGQSETMHEILLAARERADGEGNDRNGLCQGAVMGKASSILNDINTKWTVKTAGLLAFDTTVKMAGLASGFGAAVGEGNALNWLIEQYTDAAKGQGKDAVFDRIKKLFIDEKKPEFELYETSGKNGPCDYTLRSMWDIVHGTYRVYIAGDCHCKVIGNVGVTPRPVGKWWISFEGHLKLNVDKDKKTATWTVLPVDKMDFDAQCACSDRKLRTAFAPPEKPLAPATPGTTPAPTPSGPALPPAGRKVCKECQAIQDEIDADTKALEDAKAQIADLAGRLFGAQGKLDSDKAKLEAVKASPKDYNITPEAVEKQIQEDEAEVKKIKDEGNKALNEQIRLETQLRDLGKLLEDCIKTHCSEQKPARETAPEVPVPPENKKKGVSYEPDPFASRLLIIHNAERAAVGAPPLRWNPVLAGDATSYAHSLAQVRQLVHAPRQGRGIERENLLQARIGWSADRMMQSWTAEKRDFVPGYFPNVARDGMWMNVAHYTQMIWPTTTDIGCGYAEGGGYGWLVCRYSPGGNKDGKPVGIRLAGPERG